MSASTPEYPRLVISEAELSRMLAIVLEQECRVLHNVHYRGEMIERVIEYPKHDGTDAELKRLYPGPLFDPGCKILRFFQEDAMLRTRVSNEPSFVDVWDRSEEFRTALLQVKDCADFGKWALRKTFHYLIPSAFIPCVAAAIYKQFADILCGSTGCAANSMKVLDPCAGWGDRLFGAHISNVVGEYVGVDPNGRVFQGYNKLNSLLSAASSSSSSSSSSSCKKEESVMCKSTLVMQAFEKMAHLLPSDYFDVAFTSPPFFEYEVYSETNPTYVDWEAHFYEPLVVNCLRCVKPNGIVAFHIEDTTAGRVPAAIKKRCIATFAVDVGFGKRMTRLWILRRPPLVPRQAENQVRSQQDGLDGGMERKHPRTDDDA